MTKFAKTLALFILILLVVIILFVSRKDKTDEVVEPVAIESIKGCYVAHLEKDSYALNIESQNGKDFTGILAYNNYQKDNSSGPFVGTYDGGILLGMYSFDSEGMRSNSQLIFKKEGNSFIQGFGESKTEGDKQTIADISTVTYNPKSNFVKSDTCTGSFRDSNEVLSFEHNSFFKVNEGDSKTLTTDWRIDSKYKGVSLVNVYVPRAFITGTNFSDAKLTVGRSTDPMAIKNCIIDEGDKTPKVEATVSGYPFIKLTFGDAGAGNLYDTTSYRGIVDGDCYTVEYTIHSTNIGNYSPDQGIKEFDKKKIQDELEKIIKSLKFTINSD